MKLLLQLLDLFLQLHDDVIVNLWCHVSMLCLGGWHPNVDVRVDDDAVVVVSGLTTVVVHGDSRSGSRHQSIALSEGRAQRERQSRV